uniref:ParM/StbA family protein n=3 Tax=Clostridium botulinum TaxID=1491 RepID=A0A9Y2YAC9_CLOBO|nr:Chain A, ParM/StbA family protein [Clostridium botulinum Bf]7X54_B Chain B, ParM/StbA family protein [Clostridium botulinum Bf]7X54_C Chain C, ParM/StbA family protein [Clostridium botulinum Bf]7X54_D Chain D, ParM/StbA family protein [Clostridium botulinum Bf]7X54_E Chain E, ParM/StbA family protein [Clostridium botulinum Bf]7X55_A Chain A, ParM/StbA family protein [Clostridium botulinum]7X55_B Chain B, ParM/StbA family protein [Clostridium botulinum]7X55_C Chain C, ParM/StbA family prot
MKITVVDLGNINVKYVGENKGRFSSKITNDYQSYEEGFQRVEYNGIKTYIGVGELSREFNKADRDYMAQLLYSLAKANTADTKEINLTLLLPIIQMKNKTRLIETLKGENFKFKFNGIDREIKINDLMVLPEGYASYYSLDIENKKGDVCILDLGSRTINICVLENAKIVKTNTIKLGSFDFYSKIKSLENAKGEDYIEEDIQRLIDNGLIKVDSKQYIEFLSDILNAVKPYVNLKTYNTIFTGGTSLMLKEYIEKLPLNKFKVHPNALTSNVDGAMEASKKVWN